MPSNVLQPADMIQAPRPGALKASPSGLRWLLMQTSHDLGTARTTRSIIVGGLGDAASPDEPTSAWTIRPRACLIQQLF